MAANQAELNSGPQEPSAQRMELWLRIVAIVLAVAFPFQALMGSEAFYKANDSLRSAHEQLGNVLFLLSIAQVVLALVAMRSGLMGSTGVILRGAFLVLVIAQFALGYAGRENIDVRVWHIPNGVLLMGLAAVIATMSVNRRRATA